MCTPTLPEAGERQCGRNPTERGQRARSAESMRLLLSLGLPALALCGTELDRLLDAQEEHLGEWVSDAPPGASGFQGASVAGAAGRLVSATEEDSRRLTHYYQQPPVTDPPTPMPVSHRYLEEVDELEDEGAMRLGGLEGAPDMIADGAELPPTDASNRRLGRSHYYYQPPTMTDPPTPMPVSHRRLEDGEDGFAAGDDAPEMLTEPFLTAGLECSFASGCAGPSGSSGSSGGACRLLVTSDYLSAGPSALAEEQRLRSSLAAQGVPRDDIAEMLEDARSAHRRAVLRGAGAADMSIDNIVYIREEMDPSFRTKLRSLVGEDAAAALSSTLRIAVADCSRRGALRLRGAEREDLSSLCYLVAVPYGGELRVVANFDGVDGLESGAMAVGDCRMGAV